MPLRFRFALFLAAVLALAPASFAQDAPTSSLDIPTFVQLPPGDGAVIYSDTDCDVCEVLGGTGVAFAVEELSIPGPMLVTDITVWGGYTKAYVPDPEEPVDAFTVTFHTSNASVLPDETIATFAGLAPACRQSTPPDPQSNVLPYVYRIELPAPQFLSPGVTHIQVHNSTTGHTDSWYWLKGQSDPNTGLPGIGLDFPPFTTGWARAASDDLAIALNAGDEYCSEAVPEPEADVRIAIHSFTNDPTRGRSVFFRGPVTNNGAEAQDVYVYAEVDVPGAGTFKRNIGGKTLQPGESFAYKNFPRSKNFIPLIPESPAGTYTVTVYAASDRFGTEIYDSDSFSFELPPIYECRTCALSAEAPREAWLEIAEPQASPNPFRDQTEITYALAESAEVDLRVYDALGREVAALVSGTQAAGTHTATLRAGDLPGGVYVWRLSIGGEVTTGRVTLAR